jgi:hypothetical protein
VLVINEPNCQVHCYPPLAPKLPIKASTGLGKTQ